MSAIRVEPVSVARWPDLEHALTGGGDGGSCWCQWFPLSRPAFDAVGRDGRREQMHREIAETAPPPGLVGYLDDAAAGWVRVGPRTGQGRLVRSKVVRAGSPERPDDPAVWAITCLVVRREYRGRGMAKRLVAAAVEFAAAGGARCLEAYPIDTERRAARSNDLYVGSVRLFREQGFSETSRPTEARVVMTWAF
jgi:ribosomal protein S18 acetylase RimI-like enzyme